MYMHLLHADAEQLILVQGSTLNAKCECQIKLTLFRVVNPSRLARLKLFNL